MADGSILSTVNNTKSGLYNFKDFENAEKHLRKAEFIPEIESSLEKFLLIYKF